MPEYAALLTVFNKLFPAFIGQATVVFTMMHLFCYVGMYLFGGMITRSDPMWAGRDFPASLYYLLNFNTYKQGMVTLFMVSRCVRAACGWFGRGCWIWIGLIKRLAVR